MPRNEWLLITCLVTTTLPLLSSASPSTPAGPSAPAISCPAGTRSLGDSVSPPERLTCAKVSAAGESVLHGPCIEFHKNGRKQAEGQYVDGFRSGLWIFWDEAGVKVGETNFRKGNYHGARIEYYADGQKKLEENWVNGKRQGFVKSWNRTGALSVVEYRDDRPVAAR